MCESNALYDTICAANEVFMERFGRGDAAGVAELYTEDAQFLPSNSDEVIGKSAIQDAFQGLIDAGIRAIQLETLEVENYGDTASEVGRFTLKDEGSQVLDRGKFIVIWKLVAGKWKLHRDIINSSLAAQTFITTFFRYSSLWVMYSTVVAIFARLSRVFGFTDDTPETTNCLLELYEIANQP